jgi:hypothetical protein
MDVARWYREWARDFIAYPVPLTMPTVDAARWYRGRYRLPVPYLLLMVMAIGLCIAGIIQNPRTMARPGRCTRPAGSSQSRQIIPTLANARADASIHAAASSFLSQGGRLG